MSRHWNQMYQANIISHTHNVNEIAAQLISKNRRFAERFKGVVWAEVFNFVAGKALARTAEELNLVVDSSYNNTTPYHTENGAPLRGTVIGVLHAKGNGDHLVQLGIAEENGRFSLFHNVYSEQMGRQDLERWKQTFEQMLKEETLAAAVAIVTRSEVTRTELSNGAIAFEASVKGALR